MNARQVLLAVGTAVTGVGLAMAAVPSLALVVPARRGFLLLVGVLAVFAAVLALSRRRSVAVERVETGDPETLVASPAPGDEARGSFERASALKLTDSREKVEERLRKVAVDVIRRRYDCSEAEAHEMLASGEWTDDPHAAAFLADGEVINPPRVPARTRMRGGSSFIYRARRTVDAIIELSGMEVEP